MRRDQKLRRAALILLVPAWLVGLAILGLFLEMLTRRLPEAVGKVIGVLLMFGMGLALLTTPVAGVLAILYTVLDWPDLPKAEQQRWVVRLWALMIVALASLAVPIVFLSFVK
jgi:hypothetical protein